MKTVVIVLTAACLYLVSCGGAPYYAQPAESEFEHGRSSSSHKDSETRGENPANRADDWRKIQVSASLDIETAQPDTVHTRVMDVAWSCDGYVLSSNANSTSIRIPAEQFESALDEIETFGIVVDRKVSGEDVTEEYRDLTTRLNNAEKTLARYLNLLDAAKSIEEILRVEKEIERLNLRIENLKGRLQVLSHRVAFATITVNTVGETRLGPVSYVFNGLYSGVRWLFVRE